jgi:hypothetical protein
MGEQNVLENITSPWWVWWWFYLRLGVMIIIAVLALKFKKTPAKWQVERRFDAGY